MERTLVTCIVVAFLLPGEAWSAPPGPRKAPEASSVAPGPRRAPEGEFYQINYAAHSRDPVVGMGLSTVVGFGAGHFYAQHYLPGVIMALGQTVGAGTYGLGEAMDAKSGGRKALHLIGAIVFVAFRIADIYLAPLSVQEFDRNIAERLGVPNLLGMLPPPSPEAADGEEPTAPVPVNDVGIWH